MTSGPNNIMYTFIGYQSCRDSNDLWFLCCMGLKKEVEEMLCVGGFAKFKTLTYTVHLMALIWGPGVCL